MEFNQLIVREFLKANPSITDIPEVLRKELKGTNTRGVLLWRASDTAKYKGTKFFNYIIPDLGKLFQGLGTIVLYVWKPTTHRDVAKALFEYYGLLYDPNDIIPTAIGYDPLPDTVTLTASSTATTVKGSVTIYLRQTVKDLADIITTTEVDGVIDKYPMTNSKLVLEKCYYGFDFTEFRDVFSAYPTGYVLGSVATTMSNLLNNQVVRDETAGVSWGRAITVWIAYDSNEMRCVYNGPTSGYPEANPDYVNCCIWQDTRSTNTNKGRIFMHYNP